MFPLSVLSHLGVLKYMYPVVEVSCTGEENYFLAISHPPFFPVKPAGENKLIKVFLFHPFLQLTGVHPAVMIRVLFLLASLFLYLYGLEIYPGIYSVQLAVQGVEGGSLGGLGGPAVHHDAVNIRRTAGRTGQSKPR